MKDIKASLGGTVNDVILAVTTGAARRRLQREGASSQELESLRAVLPVHTGDSNRQGAGNEVAMMLTPLPAEEASPRDRMRQVVEDTSALKDDSHQAEGAKFFEDMADLASSKLLSGAVRLAAETRAFDMIITNVRGPSFPLYMLGGKLQSAYPLVPLMPKQNLGIALFSYCGKVHWGINADRDHFEDFDRFIDDIYQSFEALKRSARERRGQANVAHAPE
jgi:WS/DGAT/MGAT family acyltransferase